MMFLSGHPQIAYVGAHVLAVMALLGGGWDWMALRMRGMLLVAMMALGGMVGGAQLLPGLEMGALSNRAAGVSFGEAVATSYPPAELLEFALPRHRGDSSSAGFGEYVGAWGERLVSDYAGAIVCVLAMLGLVLGGVARARLVWGVVALASVLVGVGSYTPLYGILHAWWPGMGSFRSPGTFFAGVALALPVLAGVGFDAMRTHAGGLACLDHRILQHRTVMGVVSLVLLGVGIAALAWSPDAGGFALPALARTIGFVLMAMAVVAGANLMPPPRAAAVAVLLVMIGAVDLLSANRAFLVPAEWAPFEEYLGPTEIDVALMDEPRPLRVFEPGRELSLRQLLNDRDALLGYHPVTYRAVEEQTDRLGFDSRPWRAAWGVQHRVVRGEGELLESERLVTRLPSGLLVRDDGILPPVRGAAGVKLADWEWIERRANHTVLRVRVEVPTTLLVKETIAPGWRHRVDDGPWVSAHTVRPVREVELAPGESIVESQYRPASYRAGLFLTMMGLLVIGLCAGWRPGRSGA